MKSKQRIIFRAIANEAIGWGHLYRLIALSQLIGNDFRKIISTESLPFETSSTELLSFDEIIFCSTNELLNKIEDGDIVVADGYDFKNEFFKSIKSKGAKTIYIDDLIRKDIEVDVIINHAPGITLEKYEPQKHPKTEYYLGLDYALIRNDFYQFNKDVINNQKTNQVLFICLGGSLNDSLKNQLKSILPKLEFFKKIHWIRPDVAEKSELGNIRIYPALKTSQLIEVMKKCGYAFVPTSTLSIECLCSGLKIIAMQTADNQNYIFNGLKNFEQVATIKEELLNHNFEANFNEAIIKLRQLHSFDIPKLNSKNLIEIFKK